MHCMQICCNVVHPQLQGAQADVMCLAAMLHSHQLYALMKPISIWCYLQLFVGFSATNQLATISSPTLLVGTTSTGPRRPVQLYSCTHMCLHVDNVHYPKQVLTNTVACTGILTTTLAYAAWRQTLSRRPSAKRVVAPQSLSSKPPSTPRQELPQLSPLRLPHPITLSHSTWHHHHQSITLHQLLHLSQHQAMLAMDSNS